MALDTKSLRKKPDIFLQLRSLKKSRELQLFLALTMTKNMRSPYYGRPLLLARIDYDITGTLQNVAARFAEQHKGMDIVPTLIGALAGDSSGNPDIDATLGELSQQIIDTTGTTRHQALVNLRLLQAKKQDTVSVDNIVNLLVGRDMQLAWRMHDKGRSARLMLDKDRDFRYWYNRQGGHKSTYAAGAMAGDESSSEHLKLLYYNYKLNKFKSEAGLAGKSLALILRNAPVLLQRLLTKNSLRYRLGMLTLTKAYNALNKEQLAIYGLQEGGARADTQKRRLLSATLLALTPVAGRPHINLLPDQLLRNKRLKNAGINFTDYTSLNLYIIATGMTNLLLFLNRQGDLQYATLLAKVFLRKVADLLSPLKAASLTTGQSALVLHNLTGRNTLRMSSQLRHRLASQLALTLTVTGATAGDVTQGAQRQQMVLQRLGASKATQRSAASWLMYSMTMSKMLLNKNVGSLTDLLWQQQIKQTISNAAASSGADLLALQLAYWKQQNPGKDLKLFWDQLLNNGGNAYKVTGMRAGQIRNTISDSEYKLAMLNKTLQRYAHTHAVGLQNQKNLARSVASATTVLQRAALTSLQEGSLLRLDILNDVRKGMSVDDLVKKYGAKLQAATKQNFTLLDENQSGISEEEKTRRIEHNKQVRSALGAVKTAALRQQSKKDIDQAHTTLDKTEELKKKVNNGLRTLVGPKSGDQQSSNTKTLPLAGTGNSTAGGSNITIQLMASHVDDITDLIGKIRRLLLDVKRKVNA